MAVVLACLLLLLLGAFFAVRWGHLPVVVPWASPDAAAAGAADGQRPSLLRRFVWWLALIELSAITAGVLVAGAGGRLVMRLLAVTAGDDAQGRVTEADQVVGEITADGTIGFVLFNGLFAGVLSSVLFFAIRRWLPPGRLGALALGALLLMLAGTRIEPLRADNPDFGIVGPQWLAVATFAALALVHACVLVAIAGRLSRSLPLPAARPGAIVPYLPLVLLAPMGPFSLVPLLVGGVVAALAEQPAVVAAWRRRGVLVAGRVALAVVVAVALPGFLDSIADILGR